MYISDLQHDKQTLSEKLHKLYTLNRNKKIDLSFRPPYLELLEKFDNPHLKLPPVIHVAGTNGKGSVIAILRAIFEAAGYRVHAYTSPHLQRFNERIYLAGRHIEDGPLEDLIDEALSHNKDHDVTFFEITTAIAFSAFARTPADILLLEVGMGGRLDCTNVIENPLLTAITTIGFDHMEHLGETIADIAGEKAGIMKPGVPCVIGPQAHTETLPVFTKHAQEKDVRLHAHNTDWHITQTQDTLHFSSNLDTYDVPQPNLAGPHQVDNVGTALACIDLAGKEFNITADAIIKGIQNATWPARLQNITGTGLYDLQNGWQLFLDGGHNESAGQVIAAWARAQEQDVHLILGMMKHKNPYGFLKSLWPHIKSVQATNIADEPEAMTAEEISAVITKEAGTIPVQTSANPSEAVKSIQQTYSNPGMILICGSIYLAGRILQDAENKAHNEVERIAS